jgi:uncharacterized tellurite resistance protein B-like protein
MPFRAVRAWLGLDARDAHEVEPLRDTLEALGGLEPDVARFLAAFAYLLGRVALADRQVTPEETRVMESLVEEHGQLSREQAALVVELAKKSNLLFAGIGDFLVAREFSALATYEQKLALVRCLFVVSAVDDAISMAEEGEIHRVAGELKIDPPDLTALRVAFARFLPGLSGRPDGSGES